MLAVSKGRYRARVADSPADVLAAQRLRHLAFLDRRGRAASEGLDADAFDGICTHVLVEELQSGVVVCCFRLLSLADGAAIGRSYSARFYDLSTLEAFPGPLLEMGRFCLHPDWHDPDIVRLAWGALTTHVDDARIKLLFGCSSFEGTDGEKYLDAFALLRARHLAPSPWTPRPRAPEVFRFAERVEGRSYDPRRGLALLPPLLRTYLAMGGWVSDHAVVDREMGTLHVFTGVEIGKVPPGRARVLRAVTA